MSTSPTTAFDTDWSRSHAAFESPRAWAIAAGILLGVAYTLSPMTVWFAPASAAIVWLAGRGLPARERRCVHGILVAAIAVRLIAVAGLFLFGTPDANNASFSVFFGDEQYAIMRSMRQRSLWLGEPMSVPAFTDVYEVYGQSSYLTVIAFLQLLVGPSPYGIHLLNALFYLAAVVILFRLARHAYGSVPALIALVLLLFIPSLVLWSVSALKESLHFFTTIITLTAGIALVRAPWRWRIPAGALLLAGCAMLQSYRAGAVSSVLAGLGVGFGARFVVQRRWRIVATAFVVPIALILAMRTPPIANAFDVAIRQGAQVHLGHVHTHGHSFKLLDESFYKLENRTVPGFAPDELLRYLLRAAISFVVVPAPWQIATRSELAYLPEQMLWYGIVVTALIGMWAGLRRDALLTCVLSAYAFAASAVVALSSGNIGTLIRHRALSMPYICVLSSLGIAVVLQRLWVDAHDEPAGEQR